MNSNPAKILAVASGGGHWIQLQRLKCSFESCDIVFVSTHPSYNKQAAPHKFYAVTDANRWNKLKLLKMAWQMLSIVYREKPAVVISTGAAPGLMAVIWGRMLGCRTLWLDSIANVERISMSGRIARYFATVHLTQWQHLATNKTMYKGNVIA